MIQDKAELLLSLSGIGQLCTLPPVINRIRTLMASSSSSMGQIAAVITKDQAISSRILRLVNSAFYGFSKSISSIRQAIVILGLNTVQNLALGASVVQIFKNTSSASLFDREAFWLHNFACAVGAQKLAEHLQKPNPEDYFLAGLMHDIGILVMDQFFNNTFLAILKESEDGCDSDQFIQNEKIKIGITHMDIGKTLIQQWNLPAFLSDIAQYHHNPELVSQVNFINSSNIYIIHVIDSAIKSAGIGIKAYNSNYDAQYLRKIGITLKELSTVVNNVEIQAKGIAHEWGL